jgi:hypothetical protein
MCAPLLSGRERGRVSQLLGARDATAGDAGYPRLIRESCNAQLKWTEASSCFSIVLCMNPPAHLTTQHSGISSKAVMFFQIISGLSNWETMLIRNSVSAPYFTIGQ